MARPLFGTVHGIPAMVGGRRAQSLPYEYQLLRCALLVVLSTQLVGSHLR
jgi:hypothetical protein